MCHTRAGVAPPPRAIRWATWAWSLVVLASAAVGRADAPDFALDNPAWNGLSMLQSIADTRQVPLLSPAEFDLGALGPGDGLLVLNPSTVPSGTLLARFMRRGGRVALADDFGAASATLASFAVKRTAQEDVPREHWLRGNRNLLLARTRSEHPLSQGVAGLVTNHPSVLSHPALTSIFGVGDADGALLLSGAVGDGRLVALGDPSVLINNMLEYPDNHRFAGNLIDYLTHSGQGRLFVVTPATRWLRGQAARDDGSALSGVRRGLLRMAEADLPPAAVLFIALALVSSMLLVAATALPRAEAYTQTPALRPPPERGGLAGRVAFLGRHPRALDWPLQVFRHELEARLLAAAAVTGAPTRERVLGRLEARGARASDVAQARALLQELDALRDVPGLSRPRARRLDARRFVALIARGRSILQLLEGRALR